MNYKEITTNFELISKILGVMIAASLVLSTAATNILFPAAALFNLASGDLRTKFRQIIYNPIAVTFLFFYALFLIGMIYSTAPVVDILLMLRKYDKFLFAVFLIPLFVEDRWRNYAMNSYIAAILIALIASYLRGYGLLLYWNHNGFIEVFKQSIEFNFLMAFSAYLILFKLVSGCRYRWLWLIFLLFVIHTVLFRSVGRTGYVVFACLVALFAFQKLHWQGQIMVAIGLILLYVSAFVLSPIFKERVNTASSDIKVYHQNNVTSVGLRIEFVKNCVKIIKKHPIWGTGTGSFAREYYDAIGPGKSAITRNPHNEYMYIGVQFGALGMILLLLLFGIPLWYSQFLLEEQKYIACGVIVGIMVGCLANSWLLDTTQGHFYTYFVALVFAGLSVKNCYKKSVDNGSIG